MRKTIIFSMVIQLCVIVAPLSAFADACDVIANKASKAYKQAQAAAGKQDYNKAIKLYRKAGGYYQKAAKMKNCNCPKIAPAATTNVQYCKENIKNLKKVMAENAAVDEFNKGVAKFNEAQNYANQGQWALAASTFEEAVVIWKKISSSPSEAGKNAKKMAVEARKLSEKARKRI